MTTITAIIIITPDMLNISLFINNRSSHSEQLKELVIMI